jgi:methylenetetrahydrofolate dehydrogenase (NADP+)/methenyltetrahydrofolate cyclohydrolase
MKLLNGAELAEFIKERHAQQVRSLRSSKIFPKLAIVRTNDETVVDIYMRLKASYGEDIGVTVEVHDIKQNEAQKTIGQLNHDSAVHGIIVQLPLPDKTQTDEILNTVDLDKDVDGLRSGSKFDAATPTAIIWLLNGYNIDLNGKQIVIVGQGRLVGKPLFRMLQSSGLKVEATDKNTKNLAEVIKTGDVVITATGQPGLIKSGMLKEGAVVVDAGASTDSNGVVGDVDLAVRQRQDLTITPPSGGVGPLTVCALFENVIRAARSNANS